MTLHAFVLIQLLDNDFGIHMYSRWYIEINSIKS